MPPHTDALQKVQESLPMSFRQSPDHAVSSRLFACLKSRSTVASGLYHSQASGPLKLQSLSLTVCKNTKFRHSFFQPIPLVRCPPCAFPYALHSLFPFSMTMVPSLPQHLRSISPPNHISALPTFREVDSSLPLCVQFVLSVFGSISYLLGMIS